MSAPGAMALAGVVLCAGALAQPPRPALELPAGSRLQPAASAGDAGPVAFVGSTAIHAILVAQWVAQAGGDGSPGPSYHLLPVPQSAAQMPHFQGAPLRFIAVANGQAMLARATSQSIAQEFADRKLGVVHVEGIFSIRGLSIGSPCLAAAQAEVTEVDPLRVRYPARAQAIACPP